MGATVDEAVCDCVLCGIYSSMPGVCEAICVSVDVVQSGGPSMRDVANDVEWWADREAHRKLCVVALRGLGSVVALAMRHRG